MTSAASSGEPLPDMDFLLSPSNQVGGHNMGVGQKMPGTLKNLRVKDVKGKIDQNLWSRRFFFFLGTHSHIKPAFVFLGEVFVQGGWGKKSSGMGGDWFSVVGWEESKFVHVLLVFPVFVLCVCFLFVFVIVGFSLKSLLARVYNYYFMLR